VSALMLTDRDDCSITLAFFAKINCGTGWIVWPPSIIS
jgi:hypothetical protein